MTSRRERLIGVVLSTTTVVTRPQHRGANRRRRRSSCATVLAAVLIVRLLNLLRISGWSRMNTCTTTSITAARDPPVDELTWLTWEKFQNTSSTRSSSTRNQTATRLLIAQYDAGEATRPEAGGGGGAYSALLVRTSPINMAYARTYGHDYILCRGLYLNQRSMLDFASGHATSPADDYSLPPSRSTYNKIAILLYALQHQYDRLLILDSDAVMYDFSRDIADFLDDTDNVMLMAHRVGGSGAAEHGIQEIASNRTWNINIGVTLWNLNHPMTASVAQEWKYKSRRRIWWGRNDDDQKPLQVILRGIAQSENRPVLAIDREFGYMGGKFIRHFIRPSSKSWTDDESIKQRIDSIARTGAEICQRYPPICAWTKAVE
jgi:hypothetical protein